MSDITLVIREVLKRVGKLAVDSATVGDDDDLYRLGLTSHAVVNVLIEIEDSLGIELPDALLSRSTFETINSLRHAVISCGVTDDNVSL